MAYAPLTSPPPPAWRSGEYAMLVATGCCALGLMTGIDQRVQAEVERKEKTTPEDRDHRNKKVYDVNSDEARKIMAKQKVQGYTRDFGYIEKTNYLDLYIPVPKVSADSSLKRWSSSEAKTLRLYRRSLLRLCYLSRLRQPPDYYGGP